MEFLNLFKVDFIIFTVLGYPISLVELLGTVTGLISVILAARNKISNYLVGFINIILFFILFYQVQLYADMLEQVYYFIVSIIGVYVWLHPKTDKETNQKKQLKISHNNMKENILYLSIVIVGTFGLGLLMQNIHIPLPTIFTIQADYPYLDSFTSILSILAMYMLANRKIENWYLWILVDIIAVMLYFVKDVKLLSVEYFIFLINAIYGYINWRKIQNKEKEETNV